MIDIIYDGVSAARKRWLAIINYLIVLAPWIWYSPIRASSTLALQASRSVRVMKSP